MLAPAGEVTFRANTVIRDPGVLDPYAPEAEQLPIEYLPPDTLMYLLGSRYCETEKLLISPGRNSGICRMAGRRLRRSCNTRTSA